LTLGRWFAGRKFPGKSSAAQEKRARPGKTKKTQKRKVRTKTAD